MVISMIIKTEMLMQMVNFHKWLPYLKNEYISSSKSNITKQFMFKKKLSGC